MYFKVNRHMIHYAQTTTYKINSLSCTEKTQDKSFGCLFPFCLTPLITNEIPFSIFAIPSTLPHGLGSPTAATEAKP